MEPVIVFFSAAIVGLRQRLSGLFRAYDVPEAIAATFRARQLQAVLRLTPLTLLANLLNVVVLLLAFWPNGPRLFLGAWALAIGAAVWRGFRGWHRWYYRRHDFRKASIRALRRATLNAAVLSSLWASMPLVLFADAAPPHQLLVSSVAVGMICAGGFALATTPTAGSVWVLVLSSGTIVALLRAHFTLAVPMSVLLAMYGAIVIGSVWSTARMFGARMMAEAEAERQNEVIGLLLRDFEENASDVLWEIDADGRFCHASPRLVRLFGVPAAELQSRSVAEWLRQLASPEAAATEQLEALIQQLAGDQPFRDMPLATGSAERTRWWHVSAKPLFDEGQRCTGWRGVASDVTDAQHANQRLHWLAHFDALTGLANRHQFRGRLAELLAAPGFATEQPFAVLCLDLDHFKTVNDTLGHGVGDGLLQAVAQRLRAHTRRSDTVARLGGDEFAVLMQDIDNPERVAELTARLLAGLSEPCDVQGAHIAVRASIGIAMAPRDGQDIDTLLSNADLALYAAKSAGRGEFRFFAPAMGTQTRRRLLVEQALREALSLGQFSLAYQPQIDLDGWQVTGFEALLRWQHPILGAVPPSEFIPVAEEAGLIAEIGAWVMREACREARRWPGSLSVAVNVSPVQAMSQDLRAIATAALAESGLPPGRLELEITESIFLHDARATLALLNGLHAAGIRVALDDFGTGYSSLAYLRRFPFDTLKIDRSFIRELMQRRDARAIVKMILGLAATLNMKTVAEGVEEPAQAGVLQHQGCDALQGYLVSPPMPASQILPWLASWTAEPLLPRPQALLTAPMPLEALG